MANSGRVIIIGLDGGTWKVIEPLARKGVLPAFHDLMERGAWGVLKSTYPPVSCPAWFTFATGVDPGRLGMYNFWTLDPLEYRTKYHTYAGVDYPDFWDLMSENGFSCGIINNPMVYAKRRIKGFIVPGFAVPLPAFTPYPEELKEELDKATDTYELDLYGHYLIDDQRLFESGLRVMEKRWKAFRYLLTHHRTDLFLGVVTETDRIFHRFFRELEANGGEASGRDKMLVDFMVEVDRGLAGIVELLQPDDLLMIMSDHGFEEKSEAFHVNQLLKEAGFLSLKKPRTGGRMILSQRGMAAMLSKVGLMDWAKRHVPRKFIKLFPMGPLKDRDFFLNDLIDMGEVDWEKTRALFLDGFHVNTTDRPLGRVPRLEVPSLLGEMVDIIRQACREGGDPIIPLFIDPSETYLDGTALDAPEMMLDFDGPVYVSSTVRDGRSLRESPVLPNHHPDGIFLMMHSGIKPGRLEDVDLIDLAPTILSLFGLAPGPEMHGKDLTGMLKKGERFDFREPAGNGASYRTMLEKERIRKRIERLRRDQGDGPTR